MSIITYKFRLKSGEARLRRLARAVNTVWNYCVATQHEAERRRRMDGTTKWPSGYAFMRLTAGTSTLIGLSSNTIGRVCLQFAKSRDQHKKTPRFRSSFGTRRSLGWIPVQDRYLRIDGETVVYMGMRYSFWKSREIVGVFKTAAFVEDAQGHWFITLQCEAVDDLDAGHGEIGIDLGLHDLAALSDGRKIENPRHFRRYERQLAVAQRAGRKKRARAIHAKIANARRHHLHEQSTRLAREFQTIVVGDVSAASLKQTQMGKSVSDAGWSTFRNMLRYKLARRPGAVFIEADERYSSRTCSSCGVIPDSSPKGMGALGMRTWTCSACGASHDRDVNAARNILRSGLERQPLVEGIAA